MIKTKQRGEFYSFLLYDLSLLVLFFCLNVFFEVKMDIISQVLRSIHFDASIYLHSQFCSPWGLNSDNPGLSSFHVIAFGNCNIALEHKPTIHLNAGDLIFFPKNLSHKIYNPDASAEISTTLICGSFDFSQLNNPIIDSLPDFIHIKANEIAQYPWFESLFRQIVNEAESGTEGRSIILDKLAEILFIYILRYYVLISQHSNGLFAGLADPHISKALMAFHSDMASLWTVERLAQYALMSRSAFSDKFSSLVQLSPMQYVTFWRMQSALNALKSSQDSILTIALNHGYQSEAAFSKVFKKHFSITPGKARKVT